MNATKGMQRHDAQDAPDPSAEKYMDRDDSIARDHLRSLLSLLQFQSHASSGEGLEEEGGRIHMNQRTKQA